MCKDLGTPIRALLVLITLVVGEHAGSTASEARMRSVSPDGRFTAEIRGGGDVAETLWIVEGTAEKPRWPARELQASPALSVTSPLTWSKTGDALAFAARDTAGHANLIVLLVTGDAAPATMSWPVPEVARPASAIMWVGPTRVGAGPDPFSPKMMVSWTLGQ